MIDLAGNRGRRCDELEHRIIYSPFRTTGGPVSYSDILHLFCFVAHDHPSGGCASQKLAGRKLLILRRAAEFLESPGHPVGVLV